MKYIEKLDQIARQNADIGFECGFQKCLDLLLAALVQSEGFGAARVLRVVEAAEALDRELGKAWRNEPESDWAQEQLDRILKPVCGERFIPFRERNPMLRKLRYK